MKKVLIVLILTGILVLLGLSYYKGTKEVDSKIQNQVNSINKQVTDFENKFMTAKELGNANLDLIVETCLKSKITPEFEAIYEGVNVAESEACGAEDFCESIKNGTYWDSYQYYMINYAKERDIDVKNLWNELDKFNETYADVLAIEDPDELFIKKYEKGIDGLNDYSTYKFYDYEVTDVKYFGDLTNDYITQLIMIQNPETFEPMTIEVLWTEGKITYVVRRIV